MQNIRGGVPMKVIICDDNLQMMELYSVIIKNLALKHNIVLELVTYTSASALLFEAQEAKFNSDLIFMDIQMPIINGTEASRKLREYGYVNDIIFFTVSKEYFRDAFDVKALHYVVKGETTDEEFEKIFLRAVESQREKKQKYAAYSGGGETRNILLNSIKYYEIYRKIVTVYYECDKSFSFPQMSLEELENDLKEYGFFRIYKSIIVSLAYIDKLTYNEVVLRDGTRLPVSRNKYTELKEELKNNSDFKAYL